MERKKTIIEAIIKAVITILSCLIGTNINI